MGISRFIASPDGVDDQHESGPLLQLRPPATEVQWERYFDLRWRVLRAPWDQPRGSEKDIQEHDSIHVALWDVADRPLAAGRVQFNGPHEAQVRYMAVDPRWARRGLGSRILNELERQARACGARIVVLNARHPALPFYLWHGYETAGDAPTLFGTVPHVRMVKELAR